MKKVLTNTTNNRMELTACISVKTIYDFQETNH